MKSKNSSYRNIVWIVFICYIFSIIAFSDRLEYYRISNIIYLALMGLLALYLCKDTIRIPVKMFCFLPFVAYGFLSWTWSYNKSATWTRATTLLNLLILFIMISTYLYKTQEIIKFYYGIAISGIFILIYIIRTYGISGLRSILEANQRIGGEIVNENTLAIFLSICFVILLFSFMEHKRWIFILPILSLGLIVALTGSKKGLIDIVLGAGLCFFFHEENKNTLNKFIKISIEIICAGIILYALWQLPFMSVVRERFELMFSFLNGSENVIDYSTQERQRMIAIGLQQFVRTPVLGIGLGASGYLTEDIAGKSTYLHNNYVELLATGGILGTILYYIPIVYIIYLNWKNRRALASRVSIIILVLLLVNGVASVSYFTKLNYIIYGMGMVSGLLYKK